MDNKQYIKSPLNYVGGKYKILNQIIPKFPKEINTFVDLFGGGFNVGINVNSKKVIYNDIIIPLCELMKFFSTTTADKLIEKLEKNILVNNLNKENTDSFLQLRNKFNHQLYENDEDRILDFYTLILYSFNYQIRFNKDLKYNTPFGKNRSSYNSNTKFDKFNFSKLTCDDFVYCDPPYLITTGSYNDGNRGIKDWTENEEQKLLQILDELNERNIKFALSNVFEANGKKNQLLIG